MKIHHCSDIHLEINGLIPPPLLKTEGGDLLILNGDITCARFFAKGKNDPAARGQQKMMKKLNKEVFSKYKQVVYVLGNHEHYGYNIDYSLTTMVDWFKTNKFENVIVLENGVIDLENGMKLFAATLWSDLNKMNPLSVRDVELGMNDYRVIGIGVDNDVLSGEDTVRLHEKSLKALKNCLKEDGDFIVVTHHAPSRLSETNRPTAISPGYYSELDEMIMDNPKIKYWLHGHTHYKANYEIGETKVRTAMYGYRSYEPNLAQNFKLGEIEL